MKITSKTMGRTAEFVFACLFLAGTQVALAQPFGYAIDSNRDLYQIDLGSATATLIGETGIAPLVEGLASDASGNLYATATDGTLYRLNTQTGVGTLLGNHGAGDLEGLDFRNGTMLGIDFSIRPQQIYAISPNIPVATSQATLDRNDILLIASMAIADDHKAFFQGVLTIGTGLLFSVDPDTGQTNLIGELAEAVGALDFGGGVLYGLGFDGKVLTIDPVTAEMELIGETAGLQNWLALDIPKTAVSTLECAGVGLGFDNAAISAIRFDTDWDFNGIMLRMEAALPGDYYFDVELRRSDDFSAVPERIVRAAAIGLSANFTSRPFQPVNIDFGAVSVAGPETFTVRITNISGPGGNLLFETFGFLAEPCPGVEELQNIVPPLTVIGDPAGFKLLTDPRGQAPLLVCEMPDTITGGDLAELRGVRFTTDRDFRSAELRFNAATASSYSFDVELRRSNGFTATPERIIEGISVEVPGDASSHPYKAVTIDFGAAVRVLGDETFSLKITNVSSTNFFFQTYGLDMPCPNVDETESNNVSNPVVRGDPAGYRLLGDRDLPIPTLWCDTPGLSGFNAAFRGIRFTTTDPFTALEVRMASNAAETFSFAAELRRSSGFLVAPERVVSGITQEVSGDPLVHPYTTVVRINFGTEPVLPGTFTLKFADIVGLTDLFLDVDGGLCPSGDVVATLENNVAVPTPSGSPAGFRLLLRPDSDGDGINDFADNCLFEPNPEQIDTDADGIGNACDGDFDNECSINFNDLAIMRENFFVLGQTITDMNSDGLTNFLDLNLFRNVFFLPPGPAAMPNLCM